MPIYRFACDNCRVKFESLEKLDTEVCECKSCGELCAYRIMHANGMLYFYGKTGSAGSYSPHTKRMQRHTGTCLDQADIQDYEEI